MQKKVSINLKFLDHTNKTVTTHEYCVKFNDRCNEITSNIVGTIITMLSGDIQKNMNQTYRLICECSSVKNKNVHDPTTANGYMQTKYVFCQKYTYEIGERPKVFGFECKYTNKNSQCFNYEFKNGQVVPISHNQSGGTNVLNAQLNDEQSSEEYPYQDGGANHNERTISETSDEIVPVETLIPSLRQSGGHRNDKQKYQDMKQKYLELKMALGK